MVIWAMHRCRLEKPPMRYTTQELLAALLEARDVWNTVQIHYHMMLPKLASPVNAAIARWERRDPLGVAFARSWSPALAASRDRG